MRKMGKEDQEFTKEELKEILLTMMVGIFLRSAVAEARGEDWQKIEKQADFFLNLAKKLGYQNLYEIFKGEIIPANELGLLEEKIIDEYNDEEFWETLGVRLGRRDFFRDITKKELAVIEKKGWLPEKVHQFYERYRREFEKYGIERLEVVKSS